MDSSETSEDCSNISSPLSLSYSSSTFDEHGGADTSSSEAGDRSAIEPYQCSMSQRKTKPNLQQGSQRAKEMKTG